MGNRSSFSYAQSIKLWVGLCVAFVIVAPHTTHAADLTFSPANGSFPAESEFSVKVTVAPGSDKINAADGKISYDSTLLSVEGISKDGSVFSLWTAEPAFSNSAGTLSFSGGTPTAFSTSGTILTIKFKGKKAGSATVSFTEGTVLAADGKGTNVYKNGGKATFDIGSAPKEEVPADTGDSGSASDGASAIAPTITSTSHPKADTWYATTSIDVAWKPTSDVTAVRTLLSDKDDALAASLKDQKLALSQSVVASKDGVWYFYAQYKNDFGWGELAKRKIQIDTVSPKEFEISLKADGEDSAAPKFAFAALDELSGIDRYEIMFASTSVATVKDSEMVNGMTLVPPQGGGTTLVTVKAYDKAGNARVSTKEFLLPTVEKAKAKGAETAPVEKTSIWSIELVLTILFALIIGALGTSNYYARRRFQEEKVRVLQAVLDVREKNDKIFSAMREEFEQMVNEFDERPQLSAEEREFLEKIKEVLDISEELVETGIEELKKKVRGR